MLPTTLPLERFYAELFKTQSVLNRKHLGWGAVWKYGAPALRALSRAQTNYVRMLWRFAAVYHPDRQYRNHFQPVQYEMRPPRALGQAKPTQTDLYVHQPARAAAAG